MTYLIFAIVAALLICIANVTGLTYNTVNILAYYLFIPLSWAWMGDKIIGWKIPWLVVAWGAWWGVMTFGVKLSPHHQRSGYAYTLSKEEVATIDKETQGMNVDEISRYAMKFTGKKLAFNIQPSYNLRNGEGNCITYSAMCTAVCNHAFRSNGIEAHASHKVGSITVFDLDLCKIAGRYGGAFCADHDARILIYLPTYKWILDNVSRVHEVVGRIKKQSEIQDIVFLDYNTNIAVRDTSKPLSHAGLVKLYIEDRYPNVTDFVQT